MNGAVDTSNRTAQYKHTRIQRHRLSSSNIDHDLACWLQQQSTICSVVFSLNRHKTLLLRFVWFNVSSLSVCRRTAIFPISLFLPIHPHSSIHSFVRFVFRPNNCLFKSINIISVQKIGTIYKFFLTWYISLTRMDEYTWEKKAFSEPTTGTSNAKRVLFAYQHIINIKVRQNAEDKANTNRTHTKWRWKTHSCSLSLPSLCAAVGQMCVQAMHNVQILTFPPNNK